jgi:Ser/Thr protein kinase RdoA (MazF antagonist)
MDLVLVFAHGNFKPANVVVSDVDPAKVMLIDFDTSGCNYRGYDLVKFFRKDEPYTAEQFGSFLRAYGQDEVDVEVLRREAAACEGLSYLEPSLFFLFLATKDPQNRKGWMEKAHFRWRQYQQTLQ